MPTFSVSLTATVHVSMLVNATDEESAKGADINFHEAIFTDAQGGLGCDLKGMHLAFDADSIDYDSLDATATDPIADGRVAHVVADDVGADGE